MTMPRLALSLAPLLLSGFVFVAPADEPRQAEGTRLTLTGTVRMPDGSPASGATVETPAETYEPPIVARADGTGRFEIRGVFGNGAHLHARSADGEHQATRIIASDVVRSVCRTPIALTLAPATRRAVIVRAEGHPVEGALVIASGHSFQARGTTGADGKVSLRLPAREPLRQLVAWHRELGVRGTRDLDAGPAQDRAHLSLIPPGPLRIRVVDPEDRPVRDLELGVNVRTDDSDWAVADRIAAAHVRTDAEGTAVVPWAPREKLKYVEVNPIGPDWKTDGTDLDRLGERIVTVQVRRERPVDGRLVMPAGASPEGLLITGFGFGPRNQGDIPHARARADGSFTLSVPSAHGFVLGVLDREWAGGPWSGTIFATDASAPAEIAMSVRRATPLTVRVTRGPARTPVVDAFVDVSRRAEVQWVDPGGKKQSGRAGIGGWLRTDADGIARTGVGRGECEVRLSSGKWDEERTIIVSSDEPVEVAFHRAWAGERRVNGRLLVDGRPYVPSRARVAAAWSTRGRYLPYKYKPMVNADGTFQVAFDAENLSVLFRDPQRRLSGFAKLGADGSSLAVTMVPMAADSGTLRDGDGKPMPGRTLTVDVREAGWDPVASLKTDEAGRFEFAAVPAGVPLYFWIESGTRRPEYLIRDGDRLFAPGEVREKDDLKAARLNAPDAAPAAAARPSVPLADRVANTCRNVRSSGMHALVVLQGDDSKEVAALIAQLLDDDRGRVIWRYLPLRVDPAELKAEAATLAKYGWPVPARGQVVLVALDGDRHTLATKRIDAGLPGAIGIGDGFLKEHMPPARDARARLTAARDEARRTGRRVWVVLGGPRCGPCFRLGRWIDEHHATLDKDYVIVKVMGGLDEHSDEVVKELPISEGDGIPWHEITEPDGTILATSHGPLGNIGFPGSVEGLRHFRGMLERTSRKLMPADIEGLIRSLSSK